MKNFNFKWLLLSIILSVAGISQVRADAAMYIIGDPIGGDWTNNSTAHQISASYGQDNKYCIVVYMETNEHFALSNGTKRYCPATDNEEMYVGSGSKQGTYNGNQNYSWKYTGPTGLVKICIDQKDLQDTYYPKVWVEKHWDPKDDINDVLSGTKVMFYWGTQWDRSYVHLFDGSTSNRKTYWFTKRVGSFYVGGSTWTNFRWAAASVPSANYYISDSESWLGVQLGENAVGGKAYSMYTDGSSVNRVQIGDNRSQASFNGSAPYTIEYGTSASSVGAVLAANSSTSAIGKTNSIKYYTKPSGGSTWTEFDPSQNISLAPGITYNLAAIVTDGLIYVKAATTTLEVTETTYTVLVARNNTSYGTVSTSSVTAGAYTKPEISATASDGYYFTGWTVPSGVTTADGYTEASNPIKIHASASSLTITANFAKRFVLRGTRSDDSDDEGMPGFSTTTADMDISDGISTKEVTLLPNREYKFMIYDLVHGRQCGYTSTQTLAANTQSGSLDGTYHLLMNTAGYGTYTFSVAVSAVDGSGNTWPKVTITNPSSWLITMGQKTTTTGSWEAVDEEGGSISAKTTETIDATPTDFEISDGKYVRDGGTVTFTARPATGFVFRGWYSTSACTGEPLSGEEEYSVAITAATSVYALFEEAIFNVSVFDGATTSTILVGEKSHPNITAATVSGKVFNRWDVIGSATLGNAYSKTTSVSGVTDAQTSIIAAHKDPPTLYYVVERPVWTPEHVYVYFYDNEYWHATKGSGAGSGCLKVAEMSPVPGKNKWWQYTFNPETDENLAGHTIQSVSFMSMNQSGYGDFTDGNTGTHRLYSSCMNMFIVTTYNGQNINNCSYYNDGYWYNYEDTKSSYYLHNLPGGEVEFIADENGIYTATVNLEANQNYKFYIGGCDGKNWSNSPTITGVNCTNYSLNIYNNMSSEYMIPLTTSSGGIYKFTLTPIFNTVDDYAHAYLNVIYPVAANDYRAVYNNAASSPTISRPSNIIPNAQNSGTISLWLNKETNYITFEKATVDGFGALAWTPVGSQTLTGVTDNGVYTMTLTRSGGTYSVSTPQPYKGEFFIRTDCAAGGWKEYMSNPMTVNTLTFDKTDASTFDHYYCKWIKDAGSNVRFAVANEINMAISDTLINDAIIDSNMEDGELVETLPQPASVRFSYNSYTNGLNRAYLSGSTTVSDRFLVMKGDSKLFNSSGQALTTEGGGKVSGLNDNELNFDDKNDWVYQVDIQAQSGAEVYLIARYNGVDRDLYGSSSSKKTLITSTDDEKKYNLTTIYDFKTNNLMTAWKPGVDPIIEEISDVRSVMLVREHQNGADQITIGSGGSISETLVYGVMQFNKYTLNNQNSTGSHETLDPELSPYERDLFWISFPFDVNLRDVFGFGEYGKHWIIEYYDGQGRADNGFWADSPSNWKFVTPAMRNDFELKNGVGYILALDLVELGMGSSVWNNSVTDVALYFPSSTAVTINADKATIDVPAHKCNIGPRFPGGEDRTIKDSHWNVIGVPSFANVGGLTIPGTIEGESYPTGFGFYYKWRMSDNTLSVQAAGSETFKTMHAYMVQFTGTINWSTRTASVPSSVAARTQTTADKDYKLVLMRESEEEDHTYVRLTDDASVTNRFEFNYDLSKEYNGGKGNIWTVTADTVEVAGNSMPKPLQTTLVPVGVKVVANGEYTLSMPEGTNGEDVILIDNAYGTRTNLGLMPYTVTLTAGTYDSRFALEFAPIQDSPTSLENDGLSRSDELNDANDDVRKVFVGGRLYIIRDGKVYDAAGQRIE